MTFLDRHPGSVFDRRTWDAITRSAESVQRQIPSGAVQGETTPIREPRNRIIIAALTGWELLNPSNSWIARYTWAEVRFREGETKFDPPYFALKPNGFNNGDQGYAWNLLELGNGGTGWESGTIYMQSLPATFYLWPISGGTVDHTIAPPADHSWSLPASPIVVMHGMPLTDASELVWVFEGWNGITGVCPEPVS